MFAQSIRAIRCASALMNTTCVYVRVQQTIQPILYLHKFDFI